MTLDSKNGKCRKESLERLKNQMLQAQTSGDSSLVKKIKAIIDWFGNDNKRKHQD